MNISPNELGPLRPIAATVIAVLASAAFAQAAEKTLPPVEVSGTRSVAEQNQLPVTTESITARQAADTVNAMTTEDVVKYLPNVLVRRRYIGDTQAPMSSRTTGINASARTLIIADGIWLSTYVNNNNQNGSPQWFMVAPEEIERIDVMYGPFSAMYPGNSYGAVTEITTRMPKRFEAGAKIGAASQSFGQYATSDRYPSMQASAMIGNRSGDWSWRFNVNHLNSFSQPLSYLALNQSSTAAAGGSPVIAGAIADRNRTGSAIQVLGAGGLTHTVQDTAKLKLAYDIAPTLTAAYTLGLWQNTADAAAQSYLGSNTGTPYYGAAGGNVNIGGYSYSASAIGALFSSSRVEQEHWMHNLSLKTKDPGVWNWEASASYFDFAKDLTRLSTGLYPAAQNGGAGRITDAAGTGWINADVKGTWRESTHRHMLSFGAHVDQYKLASPTYNTGDWMSGGNGGIYSDSRGKTRTEALWAQDVWQLTSSLFATFGGRYERWRAFDGFNLSTAGGTAFQVNQPTVKENGFSPKLSLTWQATDQWSATGSLGKALRFPTVGELYQNVQTGGTFTQANPYLKPEKVLAAELALERNTSDGKLRLSLFEEHVSDALISQTSTLPGYATPVIFTQNVDKTRQRGIELVAQQNNALMRGLELSGSVTYVDARILENSSYASPAAGATSVGKHTPYVPEWRATLVATYRPDDKWAYTLAGRYSARLWATVDNADINPDTYQGFGSYFVADARVRYRFDRHWSAAAGVDNLNNREYFLFHPFPQRTLYADLKYDF